MVNFGVVDNGIRFWVDVVVIVFVNVDEDFLSMGS